MDVEPHLLALGTLLVTGCTPTTPTRPDRTRAFDRHATAAALSGVNLTECERAGGPVGPGHVHIVFRPDGTVMGAAVDVPPWRDLVDYRGTDAGRCIEQKFRAIRVPPFDGRPVHVGKLFILGRSSQVAEDPES